MLSYYTLITLLLIAALSVLCVLVHENGRIKKSQKTNFYLTDLFIALAATAEWAGIQLNGNTDVPHWVLLAVKCADYILTPMAGGAIVRQIAVKNRGITAINGLLIGNTVFQLTAVFFGWMTKIDSDNNYYHGPLYFFYITLYLAIIVIVVIEFLVYGKSFGRQNRYSLYAIMALVLIGILLQEILGGEYRTAYISMTIGAAFLFIHYAEYSQIDAEDRINKQKELLYRDSLTGLLSRYAYSRELKKYDDKGKLPDDLAVFSIDINGLKATNDSLGHAAGDELICGAAECIHKVFSSYGLCYRTGGDEFIVIARADRETAEELIRQLALETGSWRGKMIHYLSVSAGFALASEHEGVTAEKLIIFADIGMYNEKSFYYRRSENDRRKHQSTVSR